MAPEVKNPSANAEDSTDTGLNSGSGRCPGGGNANPLQDSCLGNPMDRGAWRATFHGVAELVMTEHTTHTHTHTHTHTQSPIQTVKMRFREAE